VNATVFAFEYPDDASSLAAYQRARAEVERGLDRADGASVYRVKTTDGLRFAVACVVDDPRFIDAVDWSPGEPYRLSDTEAFALAQRRADVEAAKQGGSRWTETHHGPDGANLWPDGRMTPR
jgi:hypothetical protein